MGVWDKCVVFLHDTRDRLRYVTDSNELWFMMAIGSVLYLVYSQVFLARFGDAIVSSSYDNVCSPGMGCVVQCS